MNFFSHSSNKKLRSRPNLLFPLFTGFLSANFSNAQIDQSYAGESHTKPDQTPGCFYAGDVTSDNNYSANYGSLNCFSRSRNGYSLQTSEEHTIPQLNIRLG